VWKRQENLWQQAGQPRVAGFTLKDLGGGVQSHNAQAISSGWGVSVANQSSSSATSQIEQQQINHLKGIYGYGNPLHSQQGNLHAQLPLKYLYIRHTVFVYLVFSPYFFILSSLNTLDIQILFLYLLSSSLSLFFISVCHASCCFYHILAMSLFQFAILTL